MRIGPRRGGALLACVALALSGCARFDDNAATQDWQTPPELTPQQGPQPELPEAPGQDEAGAGETGQRQDRESIPPPEGCTDHDPAVIGTCLDTVSAVAALPVGAEPAALAGERASGRVMLVRHSADPTTFAELTVDSSGGGGLTGLALSPTYHEDQLVFAYVTTERDNRVVRFARGQKAKPVLTGIPKGSRGNAGALATDPSGALLVATGNAGDSDAASDPDSLAGKVLRIDTSGDAASGNPDSGSPVYASGLRSPGGLCLSPEGTRMWVTERARDADAVYLVKPGDDLRSPAWSWREKPGVSGCADGGDILAIAGSANGGGLLMVPIDDDGAVTGEPDIALTEDDGFGRLAGMDLLTADVAVIGTVNKNGGDPVSSDDRVFVLPLDAAGGTGGPD